MGSGNVIVTERDHSQFMEVLESLDRETNAKFVFLLDKSGQQIAAAGELDDVDPTSLASLTAGNVAATEGVAQLVGEDEFTTLFHEGKNESLHITVVGNRVILLVVFDCRSSLGLVRLRVEQFAPRLGTIVKEMMARGDDVRSAGQDTVTLGEITDADLDALFGE
jgi:predicted regulator of Ras-like GTPase activity (Roadblock/LC7/MglB family)